MPNWCEIDLTFESKKKWKLEKLKEKLKSKKDKPMNYGNLQLFDTLVMARDFIKDSINLEQDEINECFKFMYSELVHYKGLNPYVLNASSVDCVFQKVKALKDSGYKQEKESSNLFRMYSLIEPDDYNKYLTINPISSIMDNDSVDSVSAKENLPKSYWGWINDNIGVKWDIDLWSENGQDDLEIDYDPKSEKYSIRIYGATAWSYPNIFIKKICKKYKISAKFSYYEPGVAFAGLAKCNKNGKIKTILDIPDENFEIESKRQIFDSPDDDIYYELLEDYDSALECKDEDWEEDCIGKLKHMLNTTDCYDIKIDIRKKLNIKKKLFKKL